MYIEKELLVFIVMLIIGGFAFLHMKISTIESFCNYMLNILIQSKILRVNSENEIVPDKKDGDR